MTREEKNNLEELLKASADKDNNIDFSSLDFMGYHFDASGLKADSIRNDEQESKGSINNSSQKSEGWISNSRQESESWISNIEQESKEWINNSEQKSEGWISNACQESSAIHNDDQVITAKEMTIEELLKIASEKEGVKVKLKQ